MRWIVNCRGRLTPWLFRPVRPTRDSLTRTLSRSPQQAEGKTAAPYSLVAFLAEQTVVLAQPDERSQTSDDEQDQQGNGEFLRE
jgi:hypothetical protein